MQKSLLLIIVTIIGFCNLSKAQQLFGNEWIIQGQPYYKFKVYQNGMYRIPISNLFAVGMPFSTDAASLQVFRDGFQIPIYISSNSVLSSSDFIEFYGEKANGNLDRRLYADTNLQLNQHLNLTSDTAYYFITISNNLNNKRFNFLANNLVNLPPKENYIWRNTQIDYRSAFTKGRSADEGQYEAPNLLGLNSSQYEQEGYVKKLTSLKDSISVICTNPYTVSGTPDALFSSTVVGISFLVTHNMKIYVNGTLIADSNYSKFNLKKMNASIPMSLINTTNKEFKFLYTPSTNTSDSYGIANVDLKYPSTTDLANATNLLFELSPKSSAYYLEFTNFNKGTALPKLFDLTSNSYLIGDTSIIGLTRFLIPASTISKKMMIQNDVVSNYKTVLGLENVVFKNYSLANNQGNFIIISDIALTNDGSGNNYINDYKVYRSSLAGGGYTATSATLQDIYNEFGYGYDYSTLAIKNFLYYAFSHPNWNNKPKQVLIIGKGLEYPYYLSYKAASKTSMPFYSTPTFGHPGSDWLLTDFNKNDIPLIPIGRLSAFNATDVKNYLQKVKDFENDRASTTQNSATKLWHKNVLNVMGVSDSLQALPIISAVDRERDVISQPLFGANAVNVYKSSSNDPVIESYNNNMIDSFMNTGSSIIQYFGHSSAATIDYGLDFPEKYTNYKKYPLIIANGCGAGNIFIYSGQKYLSERFIFTPNAAGIGFLASVNTSFSGNSGLYTDSLFNEIANKSYGKTIGEQLRNNINKLMLNSNTGNNFLFKMHFEQILLDGDPAITLTNAQLTDYSIELKDIELKQSLPTTSMDSIDFSILAKNLGAYTTDSFVIEIKRTLPDRNTTVVYSQKVQGFSFEKLIHLRIPTLGTLGGGANNLIITLDNLNNITEITKSNNKITYPFTILNRGIFPVYPAKYSIVTSQGITLKATTLNIFESGLPYKIQIDTSYLFDSPLMQSTSISSIGGVVNWRPTLTYTNGTVYYWRVAVDETNPFWQYSSFTYMNNGCNGGWKQTNYYQLTNDSTSNLQLNSNNKLLTFSKVQSKLQVQNVCMSGPAPYNYLWPEYLVKINGSTAYNFGCDPWPGYSSLQFVVIDSLTGLPWQNKRPDPLVAAGMYGSYDPCRVVINGVVIDPFFEFDFVSSVNRKKMMDFIDLIPSGNYIMIQPRVCVGTACGSTNSTFIKNWKSDTTLYGSNNSLYHKIKNMGFTQIDSFYKNRPMILWTRKDQPSTVQQLVGKDSTIKLFGEFNFENLNDEGEINSTIIGPASNWTNFKNTISTFDIPNTGDSTYFEIYGYNNLNKNELLATVTRDTSLAFIDATIFPYLRLKMKTKDAIYRTPAQLKDWSVCYTPVPEGSLNPAKLYSVTDGALPNTKIIKIAFENLTTTPMDSLLITFTIFDYHDNVFRTESKRIRPLASMDSVQIEYTINTVGLFSTFKFQIDVNPLNDQVEQFHPNNVALRSLAIIDPNLPLPVNLATFNVVKNGCNANLVWSTSEEINFSKFEIERKENTEFKKINEISASNTSNSTHEYFYADNNLNPAIYIYRLKMVDLDEKFCYSSNKLINIDCVNSDEILLFPNPSSSYTHLIIQSESVNDLLIKIIDNIGKTVYTASSELQKGNNIITIPTLNFAKGFYTVIINDNSSTKVLKLIKE